MTQCVMEKYGQIQHSPAMPTLYLDAVPEDVTGLEGAYYEHQGESPAPGSYHTGVTAPTEIRGKFTIHFFHTSAVAVESLAGALKAAFTPLALEFSGNQGSVLKRTVYNFGDTKQRDKNGNRIYRASQSYECQILGPL